MNNKLLLPGESAKDSRGKFFLLLVFIAVVVWSFFFLSAEIHVQNVNAGSYSMRERMLHDREVKALESIANSLRLISDNCMEN